jgi:hypothetical protein
MTAMATQLVVAVERRLGKCNDWGACVQSWSKVDHEHAECSQPQRQPDAAESGAHLHGVERPGSMLVGCHGTPKSTCRHEMRQIQLDAYVSNRREPVKSDSGMMSLVR